MVKYHMIESLKPGPPLIKPSLLDLWQTDVIPNAETALANIIQDTISEIDLETLIRTLSAPSFTDLPQVNQFKTKISSELINYAPFLLNYLFDSTETPSLNIKMRLMQLLNDLTNSRFKHEGQEIILEKYKQHMDTIIQETMRGDYYAAETYLTYLQNRPKETRRIQDMAKTIIKNISIEEFKPCLGAFWDRNTEIQDQGLFLAKQALEYYGFTPKEISLLLRQWKQDFAPYDQKKGKYIYQNLNTMFEVEQQEPGGCKFLQWHFGIRHFGRYAPETLVSQIQEATNTNSPWLLVLSAYGDHNNVDHVYNQVNIIKDLPEKVLELGAKVLVRIVETGTRTLPLEVIKQLEKYPQACAGIIRGHSDGTRITLNTSSQPTSSQPTSSQPKNELTAYSQIFEYFEPGSFLLLASCSTGQENGFAQNLSKRGFVVTAPQQPDNLVKLTIKTGNDGQLIISGVFRDGKTNIYRQGKLTSE